MSGCVFRGLPSHIFFVGHESWVCALAWKQNERIWGVCRRARMFVSIGVNRRGCVAMAALKERHLLRLYASCAAAVPHAALHCFFFFLAGIDSLMVACSLVNSARLLAFLFSFAHEGLLLFHMCASAIFILRFFFFLCFFFSAVRCSVLCGVLYFPLRV